MDLVQQIFFFPGQTELIRPFTKWRNKRNKTEEWRRWIIRDEPYIEGPLNLPERRRDLHAQQEVRWWRGAGEAYLTALTGDHSVVDPWGFISADLTGNDFNLSCRQRDSTLVSSGVQPQAAMTMIDSFPVNKSSTQTVSHCSHPESFTARSSETTTTAEVLTPPGIHTPEADRHDEDTSTQNEGLRLTGCHVFNW